jgi:hypothetical protein
VVDLDEWSLAVVAVPSPVHPRILQDARVVPSLSSEATRGATSFDMLFKSGGKFMSKSDRVRRHSIADGMLTFFRLTLRPIERFLAQCIAVSTQPTAFVRERIRLGDTTNFLRAAGFFFAAVSTAFLAEVTTLYLLGIGNLTEPFFWLFILLTSIPFVLFCFLLVRLVAPLSFKDVLHLRFTQLEREFSPVLPLR